MPPTRENLRRKGRLPLEKTDGGGDPQRESKLPKCRTFDRRNETSNKEDMLPAKGTRGGRGAARRRNWEGTRLPSRRKSIVSKNSNFALPAPEKSCAVRDF